MEMLNKRLTRRDLIKLGMLGLGGAGLSMATGCSSNPTTVIPSPVGETKLNPVGAPKAAPAAIKRGGTLRYLIAQDFGSMWPALTPDPSAWACYDHLARWRRDENGKWVLKPNLAESWQFEGKKAIFKIRQGIKFHDGSDLDAEVVRWNLDMMRNHPRSGARSFVLAIDPKNAGQVLDKYTLQVNLTEQAPSLIMELADTFGISHTHIVSKAAYEKLGEAGLERQAVGTGPFKFVKWESGNQLVVKRNEDYWQNGEDGRPLPYIDEIVYRFVPEDSVRMLEVRSGNADYCERIGGKDVPGVKSDPNLVYLQSDFQGMKARLYFNPLRPPFGDNVKLRQAVQYAIDREAIAKALGMGIGSALKSDFYPGLGYDESVPYYWYNPDKAKQLVKEAGYPNGLDATITVISRENDIQQAEMIKQMLDAVGIRLTIESLERTAWNKKTREAHDFQMGTQLGSLVADPDGQQSMYWADDGTGGYLKIPEVAECLAEARSSYDFDVRQKTYVRCQQGMYDSAWWVMLWRQDFNYVFNKRVKNFPKDLWNYFMREQEIWLES